MQHMLSIFYFLVAGLCEIGGGYLVWRWLREGKSLWYGVLGAIILILYGVIPTLQPANFGRVYAAYGGVFIVLSILWGWQIDRVAPDRFTSWARVWLSSGWRLSCIGRESEAVWSRGFHDTRKIGYLLYSRMMGRRLLHSLVNPY